jgi:hypothetical protein
MLLDIASTWGVLIWLVGLGFRPALGDPVPPGRRYAQKGTSHRAQSVDNLRVGNGELGARRGSTLLTALSLSKGRLAPTGSTLRVKPDGA